MNMHIHKNRLIVTALMVSFSGVVLLGMSGGNSAVQGVVGDVLERMDKDGLSWDSAKKMLAGYSDEVLVPALIDVLNEERQYDEETKSFAYLMLTRHHAVATSRGFDHLASKVTDPLIGDICAKALLDAPEAWQDEAIEHVKKYLRTGVDYSPERYGPGASGVIGWLCGSQEITMRYTDVLGEVLLDAKRDQRVRSASAICLRKIFSNDKILEQYEDVNLDPLGSLLVTGMLARNFMETDQKRSRPLTEEELDIRRRARVLALRAFKSTDEETSRIREDLIASMGWFFGDELIVGNESEGYRFHPDYVATLEYLAAHAPKEYTREGARNLIAKLDLLVPLTVEDHRRRGWKPKPADAPD